MSRFYGAPYRDERGRIHFPGYAWIAIFIVPWLVGAYTILAAVARCA